MKKTNWIVLLAVVMVLCCAFAACTTNEKADNSISGLKDVTATCGDNVPALNATAAYGDVVYGLAKAVEGTDKESLTYGEYKGTLAAGTYYVKASVAETDDYKAATAYAKITVEHKSYDEISGEGTFVAPVFETKTKGYYTKKCVCGEEVHSGEYVIVKINIDGKDAGEQVVEVGKNLTAPTSLPQREGYALILKNGSEKFDPTTVTVTDFATYNLTAGYVATETRTGKISVGAGSTWMLIKGDDTKLTDDNVSSVEQKDGYVEVKTNFLPDNVTACMQLSLGSGVLDAYHSYTFTFKASQGTYVWFGSNFEKCKFTYTDEMAAANTVVTVVLTSVNGDLMASFNGGAAYNCGAASGLNDQTLCFQDKDENEFANRGKRYTITVTEVVSSYDYMAEAQAILAGIPTNADDVTIENAFELDEAIALFDNITEHFSETESKNVVVAKEVREKVQVLVSDHLNIANYLIKKLPAFDPDKLADMTADEQTALYNIVTKYVAYVKTAFTADELANYTESRDIAMYRYYFAGRKEVVKDVIANGKTDIVAPDFTKESSGIRVTSAGKHEVTLPAIPLAAYTEVHMYISVRPSSGCTITTTVGEGCSFETTSAGTWLEIHFSKKDGKWVVSVSAPDAYATAPTVEVSQDVVIGNKGFTFTVEVTSGTDYNILIDFPNNNTIYGTQIATDTTVYKVDYTYETAAGEKQSAKYYLDGDKLALPEIGASYEDDIGTHTFRGWFAGETQHNADEELKGNLSLVAKFEITRYNEFTVTYYQDDNVTQYGEAQTYHYGDKLVLPAEPTKAAEGETAYAFIGWYDADGKQYKGGETITANIELTARFNAMTVKVKVTLTNLGGNDEVFENYYAGSKFDKPSDPQRTGFVFAGWYTTDGELYDFNAFLSEDGLTLVAKWYKEDHTKSTLYTNTQVREYITKNWGDVEASKVGKGWLFDTDGTTGETQIDANRFIGLVKIGGEGGTQNWSLPNINFNIFEKVEFVISKDSGIGTIVMLGQTLDFTSTKEKNHILFQIKDGKLNAYGINDYAAPLMTLDLSADILSGKDAIGVEFNYTNVEFFVSEIHATSKYIDPVADANAINAEFAAWCNTNVKSASELTAAQRGTFAGYLNKLYIARNDLTAREAAANKVEGIITYVHGELAKLDDSYFDVFKATEMTVSGLARQTGDDATFNTKNEAYGAPNTVASLAYTCFAGTITEASFTLPKINFEAVGATWSMNLAINNYGDNPRTISLNGKSYGEKSLSQNTEYSNIISIYKNTDGKWAAKLFGAVNAEIELTEAQANGQEALTFTININSGWIRLFLSDISATF